MNTVSNFEDCNSKYELCAGRNVLAYSYLRYLSDNREAVVMSQLIPTAYIAKKLISV